MKYTFADRYAEAGLSPGSEIIVSRENAVNKILDDVSDKQKLDLVVMFYGCETADFEWFRDFFRENDASFSLIGNKREAKVLAALILEKLIQDGDRLTILAVCTGSVKGKRVGEECAWLVSDAQNALLQFSVTDREIKELIVKITPTQTPKLVDEVTALPSAPDWQTLSTLMQKIRSETLSSSNTMVKQISQLLNQMNSQVQLMREESQMLWWLTAGFSKTFDCYFFELDTEQAAIAGAQDLAELTTSELGPLAIPAMLDRIINLSTPKKVNPLQGLSSVIDKLDAKQLNYNDISTNVSPWLTPISTALMLSKQMGKQGWKEKFEELTGLEHTLLLEPHKLGEQLYREIMLRQLL